MIYASVCSGVEAASLAWIPLGWKAAWFSEIDPFPCAVLKHRFPEVPNLGDMTKIKVETIENETGKLQRFKNESGADVVVPGGVDLLVGGTPCQSFSVAGNRAGLRGVSGLALAYCELLETMRPRWFVWENVPGVFSSNRGEDFKTLLKAFDEIGYSVAWRVLDAQYVRVDGYPRAIPQRRRRVFVVGHFGSDFRCPAEVLFEPGSVFRNSPPRRSKGTGVAICLTAGTGGASGKEQQHTFVICNAGGMANSEIGVDVATTMVARQYKTPPFIFAGFIGGQGSKAAGIGYEDEVAPTIRVAESGSNQVPNVICYENHAQDSRIKPCGEYSPQINAKAGTGGCNLPLVQECFPINSMIIGENVKVGDRQITGIGNNSDPLPTILSAHHHAVAIAENVIGRKVENGGNGIGAQEEVAYTQNYTGVMGVATRSSVRRLLPVECERLMGFPDNWTRIPWRGKPEEKCPDLHRYKACGNSMCVNVMRWIGMRIELTERKIK